MFQSRKFASNLRLEKLKHDYNLGSKSSINCVMQILGVKKL